MQYNNDQRFAAQLKVLEQNGFAKEKKNLKLLEKTNGDVEIILNFYNSKKALKAVLKAEKKTIEETKETIKGLKNLHFGEKDEQTKKALKKESKAAKKFEKKEIKAIKKADEKAKKVEKKRVKEEEKEAKKEKKRFKKEEKKIAKAADEVPLTTLPENIKTVWLDGNNMLFVTGVIRNACLKSKMSTGEKMLESIARSWTVSCPQVAKCTLIFDDTATSVSEERFDVLSARPNYATSDDALVDWATKTMEEKSSIAVFTSDRALTELLNNAGVTVFKSKKWYQLVMNALPLEASDSVDSWADQWIAKNHL